MASNFTKRVYSSKSKGKEIIQFTLTILGVRLPVSQGGTVQDYANIQYIKLQNMNNRIIELERLIPEAESLLSRTARKNVEDYARIEMRIEQYRLEYRERTGRHYKAPLVDVILRRHGAGA